MKAEEIERQFAPGECIVDAGGSSHELFIVRSGSVKLIREDDESAQMVGPGGIFGELGAVLAVPSPYRACAEEETEVLVLDPVMLTRLCAEDGDFACRLIQHLAREAAGLGHEPMDEAPATQAGRDSGELAALARAILERRESGNSPCIVQGKLKDLAEAAGLDPLDAYRAIHALLDKRAIVLRDDELTLSDPEALERLAS